MGVSRGRLTIVLATAVAALAGTPALAANAGSDLMRLSYEAGSGESNRVVVTWEGATVSVRDPGVTLLLGCVPEGLTAVRCLAPSGNPLAGPGGCAACTALIATGDGDDRAHVVNAPPAGLSAVLDGGAGDDTLSGGMGAELIRGGPGDDTASYADRATAVHVTLDETAGDGAAGEGDDVRTENVTGGAGDDVLIGNGAANELSAGAGGSDRLIGLGGPDTLSGGAGRDTLDGGPGDDTLLSFGNAAGVIDEIICGAGEDEVQVARRDRVAMDCEHVYFGGTPVPRLAIGGAERVRARGGVLRLAITARSAEETSGSRSTAGPAITASASLRAVRGRPGGALARARLARFAIPATTHLTLRLTTRARRELARRGTIRMRLEINARDEDGNESLTRRVLVVRR